MGRWGVPPSGSVPVRTWPSRLHKTVFSTCWCPRFRGRFLHRGSLERACFIPFGLGPCQGWNDRRVKEAPRVRWQFRQPLRAAGFVVELRPEEESGDRTHLLTTMATGHSFSLLVSRMGVRFHTKPRRRWRPSQVISWLGFEVDTVAMRVQLSPGRKKKGEPLCEQRPSVAPGELLLAGEIPGARFAHRALLKLLR